MRDKPTKRQSLALVDALVGWTDYAPDGDVFGRPKSPYVDAHLRGADLVAWPEDFERERNRNAQNDDRRDALLDYLQGCIDALRPEGHRTCLTCAERTAWPDMLDCSKMSHLGYTVELGEPGFGCTFWHQGEPTISPRPPSWKDLFDAAQAEVDRLRPLVTDYLSEHCLRLQGATVVTAECECLLCIRARAALKDGDTE